MFCPQCGTSQQSGTRFCPMCGTPLGGSATEPPESALTPGPLPRQPAGVSTSVSAVARPGLSTSQSQGLQRLISQGLLNPYRQRVTGYVGADDGQLLMVLLERAAKDARFCTALAYLVATRDVMAFETILEHPEQALPLRIEMWSERKAESTRSASSARAHPGASGRASGKMTPAGSAIALVIGGVLGIVAGWVLLSVTGTTNTVCNSVLGQLSQEYGGMSAGQCTAAAIGNGVGLTLVIVGVITLLSGFLAMIVRPSRSPTR